MIGREGVVSTHRVYTSASNTIVETYRLVISSVNYDVTYVYDVDEMLHHLEIDCILRT